MPINPIDIISMAPRSQEASTQHFNQQNNIHNAQAQVAADFSNEVEHDFQKPVETTKDEWVEYDKNGESKGKSAYRKRQMKKKQDDDEDEEEMAPTRISSFDIKI